MDCLHNNHQNKHPLPYWEYPNNYHNEKFRGISHYGNCLGIPNMGGDVYFDDCYEGNPLVNALCAGILKHEEIQRGAAT